MAQIGAILKPLRSGNSLNNPFLRDKLFVSLLMPAIFINLAIFLILISKIHPTPMEVPIRYSNIGGFTELGAWYASYSLAIYSAGVLLVNSALAQFSYNRSRVASLLLLMGGLLVAVFTLIAAINFAGIAR